MSCLFRSLAVFVQSVDENRLRQMVCDYLRHNPKLMDDLTLQDILVGEDMGDYVESMRKGSTWGGAIEIKAFCEIFQVAVMVRIRQTARDLVFYPSRRRDVPRMVMIEWQGSHYEPIMPEPN